VVGGVAQERGIDSVRDVIMGWHASFVCQLRSREGRKWVGIEETAGECGFGLGKEDNVRFHCSRSKSIGAQSRTRMVRTSMVPELCARVRTEINYMHGALTARGPAGHEKKTPGASFYKGAPLSGGRSPAEKRAITFTKVLHAHITNRKSDVSKNLS
jgi:hypothetical protein